MSARPVRAVLFDMTGTLHPQDQLKRAIALSAANIAERVGGVEAYDVFVAITTAMGQAAPKYQEKAFYLMGDWYRDGYPAALATLGIASSNDEIGEFIEDFRQCAVASVGPQEGALELLDELRSAGTITGIVSVNDERDLRMLVEACRFGHLFDFILSSEAARSCKPDQAIFRQAIELAGCAAEETVFVGDMPEMDIRGANRAGMRSVLTMQETGFVGGFGAATPDDLPDFTIAHLSELVPLIRGTGHAREA